jgi:biopolymer transport protein ExbD
MAGVSVPDSGGARGKRSLDLEIPLVPFIDLLCSLIVFLLMTAVWSQIARLELKQGNAAPPDPTQTATPEPNKQKDLRVELHEKGFTIVEDNKIETPILCTASPCNKMEKVKDKDGKEVDELKGFYDFVALETKLKEFKTANPDQTNLIVISADTVPYQEVIKTMDTCLVAGLEGLSVSGTPL